MKLIHGALIAAGAGIAAAMLPKSPAAAVVDSISDTIKEGFTGLKLSAMKGLSPSLLQHPNVRAVLRVIRTGEGTADADGYRRIFGGQPFTSYADHPRTKVCRTYAVDENGRGKVLCSTAAGAYQALESTWDETARIMGLRDFSPANQDMFALGRIAARGALADVLAGRFAVAIPKIAREWASMPGSPYGQPTITMARASTIYTSAGGAIA